MVTNRSKEYSAERKVSFRPAARFATGAGAPGQLAADCFSRLSAEDGPALGSRCLHPGRTSLGPVPGQGRCQEDQRIP
jgi:hypothetical protein